MVSDRRWPPMASHSLNSPGDHSHSYSVFFYLTLPEVPFSQPLFLLLSSTHHRRPEAKASTLNMCIGPASLCSASDIPICKGLIPPQFSKTVPAVLFIQPLTQTRRVHEHLICVRPLAVGQTQRRPFQRLSLPQKEGVYTQLTLHKRGIKCLRRMWQRP